MGSTISTSQIPSRGDIYNKTSSTQVVMNRILDFILRNSDVMDMLSLSQSEGCKKMVIMAESKLSDYFNRIKIAPELGKDGILYLKDKKELESEKGEKGELKKKYCIMLAFFFVRLFQVVGSLSLSILDTDIPIKNYLEDTTQIKNELHRDVPFFQKEVPKKKRFFGGALEGTLYNILSSYLTPSGSNYNINTYPKIVYKDRPPVQNPIPGWVGTYENNLFIIKVGNNILFSLEFNEGKLEIKNIVKNNNKIPISYSEYFSVGQPDISNHREIFVGNGRRDLIDYLTSKVEEIQRLSNSSTIQILEKYGYLEKVDGKKKIKGTNISIVGEEDSKFAYIGNSNIIKNEPLQIIFTFTLSISLNTEQKGGDNDEEEDEDAYVEASSKKGGYKLKISNIQFKIESKIFKTKDIQYIFDSKYFRDFIFTNANILNSNKDPTFNQQTIPKFLQNKFLFFEKEIKTILDQGIVQTKDGYKHPLPENAKSSVRYTDLWKALIQKPPIKAFCTARALQLLNATGLTEAIPTEIKPLFYNLKFPLVINNSLPTPGQRITEATPFKLLEQLYKFPDEIQSKKPGDGGITLPSNYNDTKKQSLVSLFASFETQETELSKIIESSGTPVKSITDKNNIEQLRTQAGLLIREQIRHTGEVNKLLKKIFIVDNAITLNPNIIAKGVLGIEAIATEARGILAEYYSNCQREYVKGVKIATQQSSPQPQPTAPIT